MKRLINDAEKEGFQFIVVDDSVEIGDKKLSTSWDALFSYPKRNVDKFENVGCVIIAVGA